MDTTIHHLHCRYHAVGAGNITGAVTARLDDLVRRGVEDRCQQALETALADDPAVYVLRRVRCDLSPWIGGISGDAKASAWGQQMAAAVVREIATGGMVEGDLVCFDDSPDFVAHFLADYLDGRAWERWYYFPFSHLRDRNTPEVIGAVIEAHRPDLPAVLARLHRLGAVEKLLRQGGQSTAAAIMSGFDTPPVEAFLPLAHAALLVAGRLALWKDRVGPRTAAELAALLPVPPVDWRDPRGLAAALLAALRFLHHQGRLRAVHLPTSEQIDSALRDLDWLDRAWLRDSLGELLSEPAPAFARAAGAPTPRQRRLMENLLTVMDGFAVLPGQWGAELAVRLAAALYAAFPEWQGDSLVEDTLARVVRAAGRLSALPDPLAALRSGSAASTRLPEAGRADLQADLQTLRGLGDPAIRLVERLLPGAETAPFTGVECPRAGVALLFRALLDARFPALADRLSRDHPALAGETARAGLLLGLFQRLAALPPGEENLLPGWAELAGIRPEDAAQSHRAAQYYRAARSWLETRAGMLELQAWLVDTLIGLRLLTPATLRVSVIRGPGERMLLAAGDGALAVMGAECDPTNMQASAAGWLEQFTAVWAAAVLPAGGQPVTPSTSDLWLLERVPGLLPAQTPDPPIEAELDALGFRPETWPETTAADLTLALAAGALLRLWARWLPNFSTSSAGYLINQFIARPGLLERTADGWLLALQARPLDLLLEMAGYLSPLQGVPWLDHQTITFQAREQL